MNNLKNNFLIGVITFILCIIITITTGTNFLYLIVPILFIVLIAFLATVLKERFGKTYGIIGYLIILFVIPIAWYMFSATMPITSMMLESQKQAEDLSAFQNYSGSVDAKKEIAKYQIKQDSILKDQVSILLNEGKIDSALALIKQNETSSERIKKELFADISSSYPTNQIQNQNNVNSSGLCGDYPEVSTRYLTDEDLAGKSILVLRVMRNEPFMRLGYIFNSPDLAQHFSKFNCYTPHNANVTNLLSPIEKVNIDLIKRYENNSAHSEWRTAYIDDPDGYSNIRSSKSTNANILGTIRVGEEFYTQVDYKQDWWQVKTRNGLLGYVHKSRIQLTR